MIFILCETFMTKRSQNHFHNINISPYEFVVTALFIIYSIYKYILNSRNRKHSKYKNEHKRKNMKTNKS